CLSRLCVVGAGGLAPGDALAVAGVARPVSVQVEAGAGDDRLPGDVAAGDDREVVPGQQDQRLAAVRPHRPDGEQAEPRDLDRVALAELGRDLRARLLRAAVSVHAASSGAWPGRAGRCRSRAPISGEGTVLLAARVSWRMMSTVTSCDHRGLRATRASRAQHAARISP